MTKRHRSPKGPALDWPAQPPGDSPHGHNCMKCNKMMPCRGRCPDPGEPFVCALCGPVAQRTPPSDPHEVQPDRSTSRPATSFPDVYFRVVAGLAPLFEQYRLDNDLSVESAAKACAERAMDYAQAAIRQLGRPPAQHEEDQPAPGDDQPGE